jgi:hypothetical protein
MIMRFRPANISLINRRHYLPRLLLTLFSFEKKRPAHLDGSLHITSVLPVILTFSVQQANHQTVSSRQTSDILLGKYGLS